MNQMVPHPSHPQSAPHRPPQTQREFAQNEVESLLHRSASFKSLPQDQQAEVLQNTRKVVGFIADAGGEHLLRHAVGAQAMDAYNKTHPSQGRGRARAFNENPDDNKSQSDHIGDAGQSLANVVDAVDFPGFVSELIQGVFQAVVDASIQQMEAFAELVANVSKSVDQFMKDNVSEDQARDYLAGQYPDHLQPDLEAGKLTSKPEADMDNAPDFLSDLGLPFDLGDIDDEEAEQQLVQAGRKRIAMDRQQMLATMVLMGLNRIVVTDGQIKASVVFDLDAKALDEETKSRETSFEYGRETDFTHNSRSKQSGFLWIKPKRSSRSKLNVKTNTNYTSESTNEEERVRETELKAKLTGNVDLRFKSETFPLEKMTELMGTDTTMITQNAKQSAPPPSDADTPQVDIPPFPNA